MAKGGDTTMTGNARALVRKMKQQRQLYVLLLPAIAYFVLFQYVPMYGAQIAFKDFKPTLGIMGSPWVGFEHFERFFNSYPFWSLLRNTIGLSLYGMAVGFPIPIALALLLSHTNGRAFKRFVQTVTYAPHFVSTVVVVEMLALFLSPRSGMINQWIVSLGGDPVFFLGSPEWFKTLHVLSGVWQGAGWGAIIYLAALAGVDRGLHEAAVMDGASKLQRIRHIDLPSIMPTIVIVLILQLGGMMSVGFEKTLLMQNSLNLDSSEVISTYVYKTGLLGTRYSYSAAAGMFDSAINFVLLVTVNRLARKLTETSLW
ncbi:sugar ABC transporter permease [Paenibacillus hemerocallicola]|uniref:Sugar ABC transporter permease n=1 Tax=Paenibacillus hemerocallicola TaxID=1172614 RepID=A0A5C4SV70_9BACL|nr:ABC transporter permease subunit [Paenibacillus hemerocallicola]TNJ53655.1 sugar ABC transporter permease [Paenibacillus hemerocallicola]